MSLCINSYCTMHMSAAVFRTQAVLIVDTVLSAADTADTADMPDTLLTT